MKSCLEFKGKNIERAVEKACNSLYIIKKFVKTRCGFLWLKWNSGHEKS